MPNATSAPTLTGLCQDFKFPTNTVAGQTYGVDVSHHNTVTDWDQVAKNGPGFVFVKATEGQTGVDATYKSHIQAAAAAGLATGSYHFLSPTTAPEAQADNFLRTMDGAGVDQALPPVMDLEWSPSTTNDNWAQKSATQIADIAKAWLDKVAAATGITPIIYTNKGWWDGRLGSTGAQLHGHDIWISRYGRYSNGTPEVMDGFNWRYWQFTDRATIPGVSGPIDGSVANPATPAPAASAATEKLTCTVTEDYPDIQTPDAAALTAVYDTARAQFGTLDADDTALLRVLINTTDPRRLAQIAAGTVPRALTDAERTAFFNTARATLGKSALSQAQVDYLNMLIAGADPDQIRACILQS